MEEDTYTFIVNFDDTKFRFKPVTSEFLGSPTNGTYGYGMNDQAMFRCIIQTTETILHFFGRPIA